MKSRCPNRKATKKAQISPSQKVFELQNQLEDFDLFAKDTLINLHWTPDQFDDSDYFRVMDILAARPAKDRPVDPMQFIKQIQSGQ